MHPSDRPQQRRPLQVCLNSKTTRNPHLFPSDIANISRDELSERAPRPRKQLQDGETASAIGVRRLLLLLGLDAPVKGDVIHSLLSRLGLSVLCPSWVRALFSPFLCLRHVL
ncbi:hypothetical protein CERZMDRAFT_91989 [Cercospora zeae-maydis SCOH1-5]|uniref:Uncharacterized protein n=1 Tax=Cercospora zeae-maydis SCOH1-5 TaxID=717836 RepID=A0A6A6EXZ2_9PEZI|nr:hypothetical protein CERZMDRAFT_91989 [Cercospora zeae-maydis SCOH1-5]